MMLLACYGVELVVWDRVFDGIRKHLCSEDQTLYMFIWNDTLNV